ncbi:hypothetical protein GJAV_G00223830 [Gymnothorax javanicus]|nr:hypothetical protein GJAV_G00223830 [Gymnothorax javanicus]
MKAEHETAAATRTSYAAYAMEEARCLLLEKQVKVWRIVARGWDTKRSSGFVIAKKAEDSVSTHLSVHESGSESARVRA